MRIDSRVNALVSSPPVKKWLRYTCFLLFLLAACLGLAIAYRDPLLLALTSRQIKTHANRLFGAPLTYRAKWIEQGRIIFDEPVFSSGLKAELLTVTPHWLPRLQGVSVVAHLKGAHLTNAPPSIAFTRRVWLARAFRVKWECHFEEGRLIGQQVLPFWGEASGEDIRHMAVSLKFGEGLLFADYKAGLREKQLTFTLSHFPLAACAPFSRGAKVSGGSIDATGTLHLSNRGLPWLEGEGKCGPLTLQTGTLQLACDGIDYRLSPQLGLRRRDLGKLSTWDEVLLALRGGINLRAPTIQRDTLSWEGPLATLALSEVATLKMEGLFSGLTTRLVGSLSKEGGRRLLLDWEGESHLDIQQVEPSRIGFDAYNLAPLHSQSIAGLIPFPFSHLEGSLSVKAEASIKGGRVGKLWLEEVLATHLSMKTGQYTFGAREIAGHLLLPHLRPGWERECSARLYLEGGSLSSPYVGEGLSCELLIDSGRVERLDAQGYIEGLTFQASAESLPHARQVTCRVAGGIDDVTTLWPNTLLSTQFGADPFTLDIAFERVGPSISASGAWEVGEDLLSFTFSLTPQRRPSSPLPYQLERIAHHLLPAPRSRFPIEIGPSKVLAFDGGEIEASRVEAAKFIQPLLKRHEGLRLFGCVDLRASFNGEELKIDYEGYNMRLEAPLFRITVPHAGDLSPYAPIEERAHHHFNLRTGAQGGFVPLQHATYIEKHSGLTFTHIHAGVDLHETGLTAAEMEGRCEEIAFVGSVDMDKRAGLPTDLKLVANGASGPLPGAQAILKRLSPSPLWEIETEGRAYLEEEGLDLRILFLPGKAHVEALVRGGIVGGSWQNGAGFSIGELTTLFTYQHEGKRLTFSDLTALSQFQQGETYPLHAPRLAFDHFPGGAAHFSIDLEGLAHLQGDMVSGEEGERRLTLRSSHFGGIQPTVRLCLLEPNLALRRLKAAPEVEMATLARDLAFLEQMAGRPLGSFLFAKLDGKGQLGGELSINRPLRRWKAQLAGRHLTFRDCPFKSVGLTGRGQGGEWELTMRGGKLGATAKFREGHLEEGQLHYGSDLTASFTGRLAEGRFEGELLSATSPLATLPWLQGATGGIALTGPFTVDSHALSTNWTLELKEACYAGVHLNQTTPFNCHIEAGACTLQGLHLSPSAGGDERVDLQASQLTLTPALAIDHLAFHLPESLLPWAMERTGIELPRMGKEGGFSGTLSYTADRLSLKLDGGDYQLAGHTLPVTAAQITRLPESLIVSAQTPYQAQQLLLTFHQSRSCPKLGELTVTDSSEENSSEPLTLFLQMEDPSSPSLTRVEGSLKGLTAKLTADLEASQEKNLALFGSVEIDPDKTCALLPDAIAYTLSTAKLGGPLAFSGRFELPKQAWQAFTFTGDVSGRALTVAGVTLDRLHANLLFSPHYFLIHSLAITDSAVRCSIDQLEGVRAAKGWTFRAPLIRVTNLQPTLLRGTYKPYGKNKPLTITRGEIHHFSGTADPTSWSGVGSFSFNHPPKREVANTLFALPDDLLGILGLDFQSLIPAAGQVHFTVGEGRCTISSFADVHSRGRRSQFFLADDEPSYIDFNGNLSLRVRTKQYNLILKITELFTVAIGGTLDKPTFRLQHPAKPPTAASSPEGIDRRRQSGAHPSSPRFKTLASSRYAPSRPHLTRPLDNRSPSGVKG